MIKILKQICEISLLISIVSFFIVPFFANNSIGIGYGIILPIIAIVLLLITILAIADRYRKIIEKTENNTYTKKDYIVAAIVLIISVIVLVMNFIEI